MAVPDGALPLVHHPFFRHENYGANFRIIYDVESANLHRRRMMKHCGRYISFLTACMCLVFLGAARAQASCSNASLNVTLAFVCTGTIDDGVPVVLLGQVIFNGKGKFTGSVTIMEDGRMVYGPFDPLAGTYTVNKDCTGTDELTTPSPPTHFEFSLYNGGYYAAETDSGTEVTCQKLTARSD
jgi:hypothetical protein